jgi:hypothetical protein
VHGPSVEKGLPEHAKPCPAAVICKVLKRHILADFVVSVNPNRAFLRDRQEAAAGEFALSLREIAYNPEDLQIVFL